MTELQTSNMVPNRHGTTYPAPESITSGVDTPVCGIVVAYFPDKGFQERINVLSPQVRRLVIVDNTPADFRTLSLREFYSKSPQVHVIENQSNAGISVALNQGLEYALQEQFQWIVTLDQDTQCFPNMIDTLLRALNIFKPIPAIVGGNYIDPRNKKTVVPAGDANSFVEQITVITSGCLVDARFAVDAGGFREDYFIDQVDHEFSLRARALGKKVVISKKPVMLHSVGEPDGVRLPWLGVMPNHSPLRKYYIARNTVVTIANYWRKEPAWCLRRASRLILGLAFMGVMERQRLSKVHAFMCGIVDGLSGRMGPCPRKAIIASVTGDARTGLLLHKPSHDS